MNSKQSPSFEIVLNKEASKRLEKQPTEMQQRIIEALEKVKTNPTGGKRLKGELEGLFSIRLGGLRAIYEVDSNKNTIVVHAIGPRGDIYKK